MRFENILSVMSMSYCITWCEHLIIMIKTKMDYDKLVDFFLIPDCSKSINFLVIVFKVV